MDAYVYQAALLCEEHAITARTKAMFWGAYEHGREYPDGYFPKDSGAWPQGPYADGAGEADTPQHCDVCRLFLENPLTTDGYTYVAAALAEAEEMTEFLRMVQEYSEPWRDFYFVE